MGEFGEKLRKQREQRGITLESVSNTTKIGTRMLQALEDERFDQLPGGVFNKGFVRAYARQIGLDAEEAVSGYLAALRESQAQAQAIMPDFRALRPEPAGQPQATTFPANEISAPDFRKDIHQDVPKDVPLHGHQPEVYQPAARSQEVGPPGPPEPSAQKAAERVAKERPRKKLIEERPARPNQPGVRIPWGIVAAGLLVVALLLAFLSYHPRAGHNAASQSVKAQGESQDAAAAPASGKSAGESNPAPGVAAPAAASAPSPPVLIPPASTSVKGGNPAVAPSSDKAASQSAPSTTRNTPTGTPSSPVAHPTAPAASPLAARVKAPKNFTLLIRAEQTSWVSITADGKPVAQEILIAPAGTSVRATQQIVVRTRNAGGLVFVLNGKTLPRHGEPGEARTFLFDANGMHELVTPAATAP